MRISAAAITAPIIGRVETLDLALRGTCAFGSAVGKGTGSSVLELPGVSATIAPGCPERSVVNSVCFDDTAALEQALPDLAAAYEEAGVEAWTVWVPVTDGDSAGLLERAGHVLDSQPLAMAAKLTDVAEPPDGPFARVGELNDVGPLNDAAYGYPGSFERALAGIPVDEFGVYLATVDGRPASCLLTVDVDADCYISLVATLPEARGRGLAGGLLSHALAEARGRGLRTTSLVATKLGAPIYERLGYRAEGSVQMWERRVR